MIHRTCFGSIERFLGILTEHTGGKFPAWLAPVQAKVLLVSEKSREYAQTLGQLLDHHGIRWELDDRNEKIGYMIREAQFVRRIPFLLIIGQREAEEETISIRFRDSNETASLPLAEALSLIDEQSRL